MKKPTITRKFEQKFPPFSRSFMDDGTNIIVIKLDNPIFGEALEALEDDLADFLAQNGCEGSVEDSITGNSTSIRTKEEMRCAPE